MFYNGTEPLATGYTYDKAYLSDFGGTQSLDVAKLFYDNWPDHAGNLQYAANWYFQGNATTYEVLNSDNTVSDAGYFSEYFTGASAVSSISFGARGSGDLSPESISLQSVTEAFSRAFGFGDDGKADVGRLVYLGVQSEVGGHALTCYGYTTDDEGIIKSILITNSDDRIYGLTELYTKIVDTELRLYTDADCTELWEYASFTDWFVDLLSFIDTPDSLVNMYEQYADVQNNQVWNGYTNTWSEDYLVQNGAEDLPASDTGWSVYVEEDAHTGYYSTWYNPERGVEFNDSPGAPQTITVKGEVHAGEMVLSANQYNYLFNGTADDFIYVSSMRKIGSGLVSYNGLTMDSAGASVISGGIMSFTSGAVMKAPSVSVQSRGILSLDKASLVSDVTTVAARSTLAIGVGGAMMNTDLTLADGAFMSFTLSDANIQTAAITLSGSLVLGNNISFLFNEDALQPSSKYVLILFTDGWDNAETELPKISIGAGCLSFSDKTLYYTYSAPNTLTWDAKSSIWSSTKWEGVDGISDGANVTFAAGSATVEGTVSPGEIIVTGSAISFLKAEGADSAIKGTKAVTVSEDAALTTELELTGRSITMAEGSKLTYTTVGSNIISEIDMASNSLLELSGNAETTHTIEAANTLSGNITIAEKNHLVFHLDENKTIESLITAGTTSTTAFRNSSTGGDITYSLVNSLDSISGDIYVGHAEDSCGTVLEITSSTSNRFNLAYNGTLLLNGGNSESSLAFNAETIGSGTVMVGEKAVVSFSNTGLSTDTSLYIKGTAAMGSADATVQGVICKNVHVQGGALSIWTDASNYFPNPTATATALTFNSLTLSGGGSVMVNYDKVRFVQSFNESVSIDVLNVGEGGGRFGAGFLIERLKYNSPVCPVHSISELRGSGDIAFFRYYMSNDTYEMSTVKTQVADISSFAGNIVVESLLDGAKSDGFLYLNALELTQNGDIGGSVTVNGQSDDGTNSFRILNYNGKLYAVNDPYHRALLGLRADVGIGGLNGNEDSYLYAGSLNRTEVSSATICYENIEYGQGSSGDMYYKSEADRVTEASNIVAAISGAEHTLTIHAGSNHEFKGTVLGGISIVKQGNGTQKFSGNMSHFDGSVNVQEGTLSFTSSELTVKNLGVTAGAVMQTEGVVNVTGDVTVAASSIAAMYRAATLSSDDVCTFADSATLSCDLNLATATSLTMAAAIDLNGHGLTLAESRIALTLDFANLGESVSSLVLMMGVESLTVDSVVSNSYAEWNANNFFTSAYFWDDTMLIYDNQIVKLVNLRVIPEPTTATLSMVALLALSRRRRRK